ncbi:hypothetical protein L2750_09875 [Shewanella submarina]|uniref:Ig-like domain-containing protein n=1 Tax=Shewanella submarina TaxID=2016376 RepID=A0ABV7GD46_9GAMM|nr:hypothetical protein [Shewanella submarina]MCL1037460.1 hypothetical protein [Shewanella submarina]
MLRIFLLLLIPLASVASEESEAHETVWVESPKQFNCAPSEITLEDSVSISLGENSFEELAIFRESDGTWLFLVVGSAPKAMNSLMSPAELKSRNVFNLTPETTGFRWEANGYNEKIFTAPGKYTIYNSDILESEVGGYKCSIVVVGN